MASSEVKKGDARHKVRIRLHTNYLHKIEGKYISRTHNQKKLDIEAVCRELKNRTSYEGDINNTVKAVKAYFDEAVYQVCNGHSVNTGYFTIHVNVGGTFGSPRDSHDREKNPLSARFRVLGELRRALDDTGVEIEGVADTNGYIDEFLDGHSESVNDEVSGNDQFSITGDKIKVAGDEDNPDCGVYFVDAANPSRRFKVTRFLIENSPARVIGVTPMLMAPASYRVEIVTQFNGSNTSLLKKPKTLVSDFELAIR